MREKRRYSYGIAICRLQIQHAAAAASAAAAAASAAAFENISLVLCLGRPSRKRLRPMHFFA